MDVQNSYENPFQSRRVSLIDNVSFFKVATIFSSLQVQILVLLNIRFPV